MKKELLFSVTKGEFLFTYFRGSGNGGQKKQKTSSACRCVHPPSQAEGECQEYREQHRNRQEAFRKCVTTSQFQSWLKLQIAAKQQGYADIEKKIDEMLDEKYLQIEYGVF